MNNKRYNPFLWFAILLIVVAVNDAMAGGIDTNAEATGGDATADAAIGDIVGGSNSYSSRALGLGNASFDVDIGDCVVSTSTHVIVVSWQRFQENPWCQAMTAVRMHQYDMAERILCRDTNWGTYYEDEQECLDKLDIKVVAPTVVEVPTEHLEEEEEVHREYAQRIEDLEQQVQSAQRTAQRAASSSDITQRLAKAKAILAGEDE